MIGTPKAPAIDRGRLPQLDVLRALAMFLVLGAHPPIKADGTGPFFWPSVCWFHVGSSGVDLFFVLSGFLIGGLLLAEIDQAGRLDIGRFLLRRAFKIWPAYYAYLAVMALHLLWHGSPPLSDLVPALFSVQNYFPHEDLVKHTWTVAVEEHFYLALPLVLAWTWPSRPRLLAGVFVALVLGCGLMRSWPALIFPEVRTHLRIDSLAFGVFLAWLMHTRPITFLGIARRHRLALIGVGLALVVLTTAARLALVPGMRIWYSPGMYLGYGALLVGVVALPAERFAGPLMGAMLVFGRASYSIYLWHIDGPYRIVANLDALARDVPGWVRWPVGMALYVGLALGVGMGMAHFIEKPALAWRDRRFPRRTRGEPVPLASPLAPVPEPLPVENPTA